MIDDILLLQVLNDKYYEIAVTASLGKNPATLCSLSKYSILFWSCLLAALLFDVYHTSFFVCIIHVQ